MGKTKICYKDGNNAKILFGEIKSEDSVFISLIAEDGTFFRINKTAIVFIKNIRGEL